MGTRENDIQNKLESYREELENKAEVWVEWQTEDALEEAEEKEAVRASEELNLQGAEYEAHMEKFLEKTKKELEESFQKKSDKLIDKKVDKYRQKLEREA